MDSVSESPKPMDTIILIFRLLSNHNNPGSYGYERITSRELEVLLRELVETGIITIGYGEDSKIGYRLSTPTEIVAYRREKEKRERR